MNLTSSKKTLLLSGVALGILACILAYFGNPKNMAICVACFIRDSAGAMKLHTAAVVQYFRPEIVGFVCGSFLIALATREYRSTAGSSPMLRFILGVIMMIGSLAFLGCPLRMVIRMAAGDLNAYVIHRSIYRNNRFKEWIFTGKGPRNRKDKRGSASGCPGGAVCAESDYHIVCVQ